MGSGFTYHGALAPLDDACREAGEGFLCISHLMADNGRQSGLTRKITVAWRHIGLIPFLFRNRHAQHILVLDFSNVPLAAVFPLIKWRRSSLSFLVNHNLQWALASRSELIALRLLDKWGCRLVILETVPEDILTQLGLTTNRVRSLPTPVPECAHRRNRTGGVEVIGIVGQYRPEKGVDDMLAILEPLAERYQIVLALPNPEEFQSYSRYASAAWYRLVDTSRLEDYQRTIASCDVIVLNHPADHYSCRASGLIADAAAADVPVVVRNLILLRHQIEVPVRVGECFNDEAEIPDCIERVSDGLSRSKYDFNAYRESRSGPVLVSCIRGMVEP